MIIFSYSYKFLHYHESLNTQTVFLAAEESGIRDFESPKHLFSIYSKEMIFSLNGILNVRCYVNVSGMFW